MALCSLSTGRNATPCAARLAVTSAPAITSTSLLASAIVLPGVDRGEHRFERRGAGRGAQDDVHVGMRGDGHQPVGPGDASSRPRRGGAREQRTIGLVRDRRDAGR